MCKAHGTLWILAANTVCDLLCKKLWSVDKPLPTTLVWRIPLGFQSIQQIAKSACCTGRTKRGEKEKQRKTCNGNSTWVCIIISRLTNKLSKSKEFLRPLAVLHTQSYFHSQESKQSHLRQTKGPGVRRAWGTNEQLSGENFSGRGVGLSLVSFARKYMIYNNHMRARYSAILVSSNPEGWNIHKKKICMCVFPKKSTHCCCQQQASNPMRRHPFLTPFIQSEVAVVPGACRLQVPKHIFIRTNRPGSAPVTSVVAIPASVFEMEYLLMKAPVTSHFGDRKFAPPIQHNVLPSFQFHFPG